MTVAELNRAVQAEEQLTKELDRYGGSWVAVSGHQVVADAKTLGDLLERVRPEEVDRILEVSKEPVGECFFPIS